MSAEPVTGLASVHIPEADVVALRERLAAARRVGGLVERNALRELADELARVLDAVDRDEGLRGWSVSG